VFGPDKEEVTGEWRILVGVKGINSEHLDRINPVQSIVCCRSGEC